jgi:hypothetical protein
LNAKPGHVLDKLVAEKIFGWTKKERKNPEQYMEGYRHTWVSPDGTIKTIGLSIPGYSTELEPAFKVVERMAELEFEFTLTYDEGGWSSYFMNAAMGCAGEEETNNGAAYSICVSALEALSER